MRLLVVLVFALACRSGDPPKPATSAPITEPDARAFAEKLAVDMRACDTSKLTPLIEHEDAAVLAGTICGWMSGISSYRLVGIKTELGKPAPIMRRLLTHPQTAALLGNYDRLELTRGADGSVRLADVFAYRQGTRASDRDTAANAHPGLRQAREALRTGDRAKAIEHLDALPAMVAKDRSALILRLQATVASPDAHEAALKALTDAFPDDPTVALAAIDGALGSGDHDAALHWLDVLEKAVGHDAFIDYQRALAHIGKRDLAAATKHIDAALAAEPTLTHALQLRLDILIEQKAWKDVLAVMQELEAKHDVRFDEAKLRAEPRLAEFLETPAVTRWLAER